MPMVLESDLKVFLSGIHDKIKKNGDFRLFKKDELPSDKGDHDSTERNIAVNMVNEKWIDQIEGDARVSKKHSLIDRGNEDEYQMSEDPECRKRKRESYLGMLSWILNLAKNPCNLTIGSLPERQKWKYYGSENLWKKFLLVREAMLLKRNLDESSQQSIWQKKQKMHPSMYNFLDGSEKLRCSQRILIAKDSSGKTREQFSSSSGFQADENSVDKQQDSMEDSVGFIGNSTQRKRIPVGTLFQAHVPEYPELDYKANSKWLGTTSWPLEKRDQNRTLIERDPIGKGRQESCGCQFHGSLECVRFHVAQKRMKLKLDLGLAFHWWKFYSMGEEVALTWTEEEQNKFHDIVKLNRLSCEKYFWDELFMCFPRKGREALVSYYFNVFHLRLRGQQNRNKNSNIHSDDEESEFGPICNRFGQIVAQSPGTLFGCLKKTPSTRL